MASKKPKGLGLGLEVLLGPRVDDEPRSPLSRDAPHALPLERLRPGRYQPRTKMDDAALAELAESIKAQGVMQPVLVRRIRASEAGVDGVVYEIIAGERRVRAARLAGLDAVPVLVRDVSDEAAAAMALIENIQREDLNPLEEARGLKRLVDEFGMTHETAARAVGRSRSAASNLVRLLALADPVQDLLMSGAIEMGHARAVLTLKPAQQIALAREIAARKWSVREAERHAARLSGAHPSAVRTASSDRAPVAKGRDLLRIEEELADRLAAAVEIRIGKRKGRSDAGEIAIAFASHDELEGLLSKLGRP